MTCVHKADFRLLNSNFCLKTKIGVTVPIFYVYQQKPFKLELKYSKTEVAIIKILDSMKISY